MNTLNQLITWLQSNTCSKPIGAPNSYMRGWHDCIDDVLRKIEEFEAEKEATVKESLTTDLSLEGENILFVPNGGKKDA